MRELNWHMSALRRWKFTDIISKCDVRHMKMMNFVTYLEALAIIVILRVKHVLPMIVAAGKFDYYLFRKCGSFNGTENRFDDVRP